MAENVVGSIVGFLRLDADQFHRGIAQAIAEVKALKGLNPKVEVKADVDKARREIDTLTRSTGKATVGVERMGRSFRGRGMLSAPVIIGGIGAGIALLGPVTGAATAALGGLVGIVGTGILAFQGFKKEIEDGTALGQVMQSGLASLKDVFVDLGAAAARSMSGGVLGAMATLRTQLPGLSGDVRTMGKHLGNALSISAEALVSGLRTVSPLLVDGAQYAERFAIWLRSAAESPDFRAFIDYSRRMLPEVASALRDVGVGVADMARMLSGEGEGLVKVIGAIGRGMSALATGMDVFRAATKGDVKSIGELVRKYSEWQNGTGLVTASMSNATTEILRQAPVVSSQAVMWGVTTDSLMRVQQAQQAHATAAAEATLQMQLENNAAGLLKQTLDELNGEALTAAEATNRFEQSLVTMGDHTTKTGKKVVFTTKDINGMSAASVALRGQLIGQVRNLEAVVQANGGLTDSTGKAVPQIEALRKKILDNAAAHGHDRKAVAAYIDTILKVPKSVPPTKLDVDNRNGVIGIEAFKRALASIQSAKTVTVNTRYTYTGQRTTSGGRSTQGGSTFDADGSIKYFAGGGISAPIAQIAPAGAMRVWAEPETGGEAYIPLSRHKAPRSERVLAETNRRMGDPLGANSGGVVELGATSIAGIAAAVAQVQLAVAIRDVGVAANTYSASRRG